MCSTLSRQSSSRANSSSRALAAAAMVGCSGMAARYAQPGRPDQRREASRQWGRRILVFQHHPASPAGLVGERMAARAARVTTLDAQAGVDLPADAAEHDGLLILGGAMNAYDDERCRHLPGPARARPHLRRRGQAGARHLPGRPAAGPRLGCAGASRGRTGVRRRAADPDAGGRFRSAAPGRARDRAGDAVARGHLRPARGRRSPAHRHGLPQPGLPRRRGRSGASSATSRPTAGTW